ncbi:TPA: aldo/keto reductase [Pseudomonas aeruginosa]|uniref:aldo/keto reductase n=1 Tax=Pseudomonas aeruginosa TaxID=287 RepID=UPI0028B8AF09|nr:aldo/keto reductase [Pseudomonas aeruginosa]HCF1994545.1 aldo/keto reductase [Pseudomonas aeruginosa]HCL3732309.1 aldo/keto reductase [Pseudomonas aeruginosa]HDZ3452600.1 aldo/keto reductase [Pseudomonas aeruginosa]
MGDSDRPDLRNEAILSIASRHQRTPAQVVLRWHLQEGIVPLPRTSKASRLTENLSPWDFMLNDVEMERIAQIDHPRGNTQPLPDDMNSSF